MYATRDVFHRMKEFNFVIHSVFRSFISFALIRIRSQFIRAVGKCHGVEPRYANDGAFIPMTLVTKTVKDSDIYHRKVYNFLYQ